MKLSERFCPPENFDAVADGVGWVMYAGGNDWENGITGIAVTFPSDEQLQRIWMTVKHEHSPDSGEKGSSEHEDAVKERGHGARGSARPSPPTATRITAPGHGRMRSSPLSRVRP